ncbi:hypothetical protein [Enterobacter hormaechei]|uniref:hypothetical protein n=1 Tax=Enterobacter hormaechei TaxID=158836 RepID=UPI000793637D|nr:hypothetical protein [Enterobacter hormaechei]ELC6352020.1 hypothetical protein [Enterobacter hormaechei]SAF45958.1 Uncharacterised protein [Enterobacter hormaechei]
MLIKARRMLVLPDGESFKQITKTYKSSLIPTLGMLVQDSMWHDQLEICEVVCHFNEDCYYTLLPNLKINSTSAFESQKETLSLHGWTVSP